MSESVEKGKSVFSVKVLADIRNRSCANHCDVTQQNNTAPHCKENLRVFLEEEHSSIDVILQNMHSATSRPSLKMDPAL